MTARCTQLRPLLPKYLCVTRECRTRRAHNTTQDHFATVRRTRIRSTQTAVTGDDAPVDDNQWRLQHNRTAGTAHKLAVHDITCPSKCIPAYASTNQPLDHDFRTAGNTQINTLQLGLSNAAH